MRVLNDTKNIVILAFFENNLIKIQLFYKKLNILDFAFLVFWYFDQTKFLYWVIG